MQAEPIAPDELLLRAARPKKDIRYVQGEWKPTESSFRPVPGRDENGLSTYRRRLASPNSIFGIMRHSCAVLRIAVADVHGCGSVQKPEGGTVDCDLTVQPAPRCERAPDDYKTEACAACSPGQPISDCAFLAHSLIRGIPVRPEPKRGVVDEERNRMLLISRELARKAVLDTLDPAWDVEELKRLCTP